MFLKKLITNTKLKDQILNILIKYQVYLIYKKKLLQNIH